MVLGSKNVAFTVGMTFPKDGHDVLPFFAFAPADAVMRELGIEDYNKFMQGEDVMDVRDTFDRLGVLIFVDTLHAAEVMMSMMSDVLDRACETPWVNRTSQKETLQ